VITVGIDIAKLHFDLYLLPEGTCARYDNNAQGIQDCRLFLAQAKPERILLEATGGYETALAVELQAAAIPRSEPSITGSYKTENPR
jgi:transposase